MSYGAVIKAYDTACIGINIICMNLISQGFKQLSVVQSNFSAKTLKCIKVGFGIIKCLDKVKVFDYIVFVSKPSM